MITTTKEVLAKSEPPISLKQHIDECLGVCESLRNAFERLPVGDSDRFWQLIRLGIIFHDLGKSHSEFQKMLSKERTNWYHQRHELFSVSFVEQLELPEEDKSILKLIIAGHHKDFNFLFDHIQHGYKTGEDLFSFGEDGKLEWDEETQKLNQQFIQAFLKEYNVPFKISSLTFPLQLIKDYARNPINASNIVFQELLMAAGALKQCDHSASAGIFKVNVLEEKHFNFLYDTEWRPYYHQKRSSEINGNIILTAPTGSGKTEASLMWLHKQIKENGQGRTFYILPFTASINAMFERLDHKMQGNNEIVGVVHGKLTEYIESRFGEEDYSLQNEKIKYELKDSFRALVPPLKVTTPFQLLKSIFGLKGFEKGIFEMSGGYFIFDEIHAYDPEVTAQIKVLIEFASRFLNVNVCLMTATLPSFLKREFSEALGSYTEVCADEELYQSFVRHRIRVNEGLLFDHVADIQLRLDSGDKVLVVSNTVKQAQAIYKILNASKKVLLHSAFNGVDRNQKENELKSDDVKLLVGTQAIEVSLDIDYDVIFTEPAPLDALLQRFGRVNRHRLNGHYRLPCDCIIFSKRNDVDKYIYKNEEIIFRTLNVLREIEAINSGVVSEIELQKYIDQVYPDWSVKDKDDFDRVYSHLKADVLENLSPFIFFPHREEEFEKQFDGIKVLPSIKAHEYQELLEANKFIKAESLKVSITKQRFASLISKEGIQREVSAFQLIRKEVIKEQSYFIINRKYDDNLGLQLDVEESSQQSQFY
ncbi:CRISPR-associated helicase/endonuclease Cas3 [Geofilum rubicundum]|uniref:CRISPR-associated helicase Cas3 n=1 Tax=Geofilum rubicundum JCM 15548 TaxID=1236989 RepID=A0A0E9LU18_9BACT|nr:CRISPR-associated helicase/endonuclease Cas3 [Geofilum rubicundum]GAO28626.1 CRISPR-associated helicase Cas3 [Geofilum rubicundum JCM 15548]